MKKTLLAGLAIGAMICSTTTVAEATPILWGPTSFLSSADTPTGFYAGGSPTALEDFEDGTLDFGITASTGLVIGTANNSWLGLIDSVGNGGNPLIGNSWFSASGSTGVTFTFQNPVTAAGMVWTDGAGETTFEVFRGTTSLGTITATIADSYITGSTGEDRFFGVQDLDGITSIKMSNAAGGIEVDFIQYGDAFAGGDPDPVPEPATMLLFGTGLAGLIGSRVRRKNKS